jgi:hypothetical protein
MKTTMSKNISHSPVYVIGGGQRFIALQTQTHQSLMDPLREALQSARVAVTEDARLGQNNTTSTQEERERGLIHVGDLYDRAAAEIDAALMSSSPAFILGGAVSAGDAAVAREKAEAYRARAVALRTEASKLVPSGGAGAGSAAPPTGAAAQSQTSAASVTVIGSGGVCMLCSRAIPATHRYAVHDKLNYHMACVAAVQGCTLQDEKTFLLGGEVMLKVTLDRRYAACPFSPSRFSFQVWLCNRELLSRIVGNSLPLQMDSSRPGLPRNHHDPKPFEARNSRRQVHARQT